MEDDGRSEVYNISADTDYPIRYFVNNEGVIPTKCGSIQFSVIATNVAGTSEAGIVVGGFPIGE